MKNDDFDKTQTTYEKSVFFLEGFAASFLAKSVAELN